KILLAIFPPHSTQSLQLLNAVCFAPLAQNYSSAVTQHLHDSQGILGVPKNDFFMLFWQSWQQTFTKELIIAA
ncbi:uncharacterized protein M421DRAFT_410446, partial [Didymella exigua CBS 183.55]